jgi:hypothetical protein
MRPGLEQACSRNRSDEWGEPTAPADSGSVSPSQPSGFPPVVETYWRRVTGRVLPPSDVVDRLRFGRPIGRGNYAHLRNARKALQTNNLSLRLAEREGFEP